MEIAIVGAGTWGNAHAKVYNEYSNVHISGICDIDFEKANVFAKKHNINKVFTDYKQMLDESGCDAVAIVTPDFLHRDIALDCALMGKHMIIEKPLATKREDVMDIFRAAQDNNVRIMVDFHNRWSPPFNLVKQLLSSDRYGKPISGYIRLNDVMWVATDMLSWTAQSSILWFLGSHSVDTLTWLVDDIPEEVFTYKTTGILKSMGVESTDLYQTAIRFKNGVIAQMENGWITPNGNSNINDFKFNLLCEKGKFDIDASSHNLLQVTTDKDFKTEDILVQNQVFDKTTGFSYESIRSFVDKLISGEEFHITLKEAANVSLTILAIIESAQTGKPIRPDLLQ